MKREGKSIRVRKGDGTYFHYVYITTNLVNIIKREENGN